MHSKKYKKMPSQPISRAHIQAIVLDAISATNLARDSRSQLEVSPEASLYGPDSALDSLGLVGLLIDIEETLLDQGCEISLNDERAMSQRHSPFRSVATLVDYICELTGPRAS